MHELSICRSIAGIVDRHAAGRGVRTIHLRVGTLRQIVPDTLVYCWSLVSTDTALAGSRLAVESVPARLSCRGCGEITDLADPVFVCAHCGSSDVAVAGGEEFLITALDLEE